MSPFMGAGESSSTEERSHGLPSTAEGMMSFRPFTENDRSGVPHSLLRIGLSNEQCVEGSQTHTKVALQQVKNSETGSLVGGHGDVRSVSGLDACRMSTSGIASSLRGLLEQQRVPESHVSYGGRSVVDKTDTPADRSPHETTETSGSMPCLESNNQIKGGLAGNVNVVKLSQPTGFLGVEKSKVSSVGDFEAQRSQQTFQQKHGGLSSLTVRAQQGEPGAGMVYHEEGEARLSVLPNVNDTKASNPYSHARSHIEAQQLLLPQRRKRGRPRKTEYSECLTRNTASHNQGSNVGPYSRYAEGDIGGVFQQGNQLGDAIKYPHNGLGGPSAVFKRGRGRPRKLTSMTEGSGGRSGLHRMEAHLAHNGERAGFSGTLREGFHDENFYRLMHTQKHMGNDGYILDDPNRCTHYMSAHLSGGKDLDSSSWEMDRRFTGESKDPSELPLESWEAIGWCTKVPSLLSRYARVTEDALPYRCNECAALASKAYQNADRQSTAGPMIALHLENSGKPVTKNRLVQEVFTCVSCRDNTVRRSCVGCGLEDGQTDDEDRPGVCTKMYAVKQISNSPVFLVFEKGTHSNKEVGRRTENISKVIAKPLCWLFKLKQVYCNGKTLHHTGLVLYPHLTQSDKRTVWLSYESFIPESPIQLWTANHTRPVGEKSSWQSFRLVVAEHVSRHRVVNILAITDAPESDAADEVLDDELIKRVLKNAQNEGSAGSPQCGPAPDVAEEGMDMRHYNNPREIPCDEIAIKLCELFIRFKNMKITHLEDLDHLMHQYVFMEPLEKTALHQCIDPNSEFLSAPELGTDQQAENIRDCTVDGASTYSSADSCTFPENLSEDIRRKAVEDKQGISGQLGSPLKKLESRDLQQSVTSTEAEDDAACNEALFELEECMVRAGRIVEAKKVEQIKQLLIQAFSNSLNSDSTSPSTVKETDSVGGAHPSVHPNLQNARQERLGPSEKAQMASEREPSAKQLIKIDAFLNNQQIARQLTQLSELLKPGMHEKLFMILEESAVQIIQSNQHNYIAENDSLKSGFLPATPESETLSQAVQLILDSAFSMLQALNMNGAKTHSRLLNSGHTALKFQALVPAEYREHPVGVEHSSTSRVIHDKHPLSSEYTDDPTRDTCTLSEVRRTEEGSVV